MDRVQLQTDREAIAFALGLIPEPVRDLVSRAHFLARTDAIAAGLHSYEWIGGTVGRLASHTAHVVWTFNHDGPKDRRHPTVVLPEDEDFTPEVIVHELGHVLDELKGFSCPTPKPVSWYAGTDPWEAFAEAFTAWVLPGYEGQETLRRDVETVRFFEELRS